MVVSDLKPDQQPESLLEYTSHRPWPLPNRRWVMVQVWSNLLFAHWPVDYSAIRALVPPELPLDSYNGHAWIGVTPFELSLVRPRGFPAPLLSSVPEINVRTYVTIDEKPGVYFFSLDIRSFRATLGARLFYKLPYYPARMSVEPAGQAAFRYRSERIGWRRPARFRASYWPASGVRMSHPGSLEYFLTERYCLYTARPRGVFRTDIHHLPWPLQDAAAEIAENSMARAAGLSLPDQQPLTHFSRHLVVLAWLPRRVHARASARLRARERVLGTANRSTCYDALRIATCSGTGDVGNGRCDAA